MHRTKTKMQVMQVIQIVQIEMRTRAQIKIQTKTQTTAQTTTKNEKEISVAGFPFLLTQTGEPRNIEEETWEE